METQADADFSGGDFSQDMIMRFSTIIVGAGRGERLGVETPKCLLRIGGVPLMLLSVYPFERVREAGEVILVVPRGFESDVQSAVDDFGLESIKAVVPGGERRQDSVLAGVKALSEDVERVIIHDGARPLLSIEVVERFIDTLREERAAVVGLPVTDTLHTAKGIHAYTGPSRSDLIAAQTPQGFEKSLIVDALTKAEEQGLDVTDEVTLVRETMGVNAGIVLGEIANVKITRPDDLTFYKSMLRARVRQLKGRRR